MKLILVSRVNHYSHAPPMSRKMMVQLFGPSLTAKILFLSPLSRVLTLEPQLKTDSQRTHSLILFPDFLISPTDSHELSPTRSGSACNCPQKKSRTRPPPDKVKWVENLSSSQPLYSIRHKMLLSSPQIFRSLPHSFRLFAPFTKERAMSPKWRR